MVPLSVADRIEVRSGLASVIGERGAEALVNALPSAGDELATKDFVRAEISVVRTEMAEEFGKVRTEMAEEFGKVRTEMANGFEMVGERMRQQTIWFAGLVVGSVSALAAVFALLR